MFSTSSMAIFKGIVLEIKNVELDFSGVKEYRAIAQIEVKEVFQGSCKEGETVSVLLPCPISEDIWVEDTDVISAMKSGMTGIFMPVLYNDENSIWKQNNACLVKKDIAEYGLLDGLQYAFLETESGLVFSKENFFAFIRTPLFLSSIASFSRGYGSAGRRCFSPKALQTRLCPCSCRQTNSGA